MVHKVENFRDDKGIVDLQFLQVSHPSAISSRFYDSPKLKKWMCELYTFLQIQSHILIRI